MEDNEAMLKKAEHRLAKSQGRNDEHRSELVRRQKRLELLHGRSGKRAMFNNEQDFEDWLNREAEAVSQQVTWFSQTGRLEIFGLNFLPE